MVMWAIKQLCVPVRYLRIEQGVKLFESKAVYDFVLPGTLSLLTTVAAVYFNVKMGFSGGGLIASVINLLNLLIAFFIAALAAVSTFQREGLDAAMKGSPATLDLITADGTQKEYILTHRQFICYLFGYLSFISICFLIALHFLGLFGKEIEALISSAGALAVLVGRVIASLSFFFIFWQIIITMMVGIYFLCDRLQFLDKPEI